MNTETLSFKVSPSIIRHLIERQAGTLDKALLELVMNGIDAGAERIDVLFVDGGTIHIKDDGRGFISREEIEAHFQTFGFDHNTEAEQKYGRQNGRFGIGRSQVSCFGRTVWRTHEFRMDVDIRGERDLAFELTTVDDQVVRGCHIEVSLYESLSAVEIERIRRTLKEHVVYAPSAVYVDDTRVNKDLSVVKWTEETERLLFLHKPTAEYGLEVHNQGIFVSRFPYSMLGVSGNVVSKTPHSFKVTMSRTDIHRSCDLFAEMKSLVTPYREKQRRQKRLNDSDRMGILRDWYHGELVDRSVMGKARLFKDVRANYLSFEQLRKHANGLVAIAGTQGDRVAESIHQSHAAAVLSPAVKDWLDVSSIDELVDALNVLYLNYHNYAQDVFSVADYEAMRIEYNGKLVAVDRKEWTKVEAAMHAAVQSALGLISNGVRYGQERISLGYSPRRLLLGDSRAAQAWTDGKNYVCLERQFLRTCFGRNMDGIAQLVGVLVHEFLHTDSDMGDAHQHPPEFFEAYENVLTSGALGLYSVCANIAKRYDKERAKLGLSRSLGVARMIDQAATG